MARKRSGRSYTASVQAEELLAHKQQIAAIDPTGARWGLRSSASGEGAGYPVVVFGAANVFQHGSEPSDFRLAHTLAIVAVRKGYSDGTWIAAATLDRYLQSIKQPQIYGTQFITPDGKATAQDPYNQTLIPDALRWQFQVPDLAAQKVQRQQYDSQRHIDSKNAKP